jgi:hypothetical protein
VQRLLERATFTPALRAETSRALRNVARLGNVAHPSLSPSSPEFNRIGTPGSTMRPMGSGRAWLAVLGASILGFSVTELSEDLRQCSVVILRHSEWPRGWRTALWDSDRER